MKKRILSALLAVVMVILILPVQTFAATEEIKGAYVDIAFDSVIANVVGAKTYSKSGSVPDGMSLSGSWAYKSKFGDYVFKMVLEGTPTKAGTYNFSVSYKKEDGKTLVSKVDYTITVGEKAPFDYIGSIFLDKWPDKTVYYLGDEVDLTGMKVTAVAFTYNKNLEGYEPEEIEITEYCWVDPAIFTNDEAQSVSVYAKLPGDSNGNLKLFEDSFRVTFKYADPDDVLRIEVYEKPSKLTYTVGETLDTTGMTVRLHKGDGSAEDITEGFKTDVTTLDTVGTQTVTVSHGEGEEVNTATFDVTVTEKVEEPEDDDNKGGIPFWVWIIIALLVILVAAAVALFLIGRRRLDDEE